MRTLLFSFFMSICYEFFHEFSIEFSVLILRSLLLLQTTYILTINTIIIKSHHSYSYFLTLSSIFSLIALNFSLKSSYLYLLISFKIIIFIFLNVNVVIIIIIIIIIIY